VATEQSHNPLVRFTETIGQRTVAGLEELGYTFSLFVESLYWIVSGNTRNEPVRLGPVVAEMMKVGIQAIPIASLLAFTVGIMLAIQGIHTLKAFGAESQVVLGIALSVTREFAPLIIGVLVAGRSGSAITARIGTMQVSQEIDALRAIGISPVRYLVAPALVATVVMLPSLTILADIMGLLGGAVYSSLEMNITIVAYVNQSLEVLHADDIVQGLVKSVVFAIIIALVGASNGFSVRGGAEGVGRATTRSVVLAISYIVVADMLFTYFLNR